MDALDRIGLRLAADDPPDCNSDDPASGRGCDLPAGHAGQHVSGSTTWTDSADDVVG